MTELRYSSSDPDVAIVAPDGTITALSKGTALITVFDTDYHTIQLTVIVEAPQKQTLLGDVNGDGIVNASDAAQILIAAAAFGAGNSYGLTNAQITAADVNGDGSINASDAAVILIYAAGIGAGQDVKIEDFVNR